MKRRGSHFTTAGLALGLMLLVSIAPAAGETGKSGPASEAVVATPAPLRLGARVIATLPAGTRVTLREPFQEWIGVEAVVDSRKVSGWIRADQLRGFRAPPAEASQATPARHEQPIQALAFSPDGTQLLTAGSDRIAIVWEVASGRATQVFRGHDAAITAIGFSPSGRYVVTGSDDGTARLWSVASGRPVRVYRPGGGRVTAVALGPGGARLATGSADGTLALWDTVKARTERTLRGSKAEVTAVAFSRDGLDLVSGSVDGTVTLWRTLSGEKQRIFRGSRVLFSPSGAQLLTGMPGEAPVLWGAVSGQPLRRFSGGSGSALAFSPGGRYVITGAPGKTALLWDKASGDKLRTFGRRARDTSVYPVAAGGADDLHALAFSPSGRQIATEAGAVAVLWDIASGQRIRVLDGRIQPPRVNPPMPRRRIKTDQLTSTPHAAPTALVSLQR